MQQGNKGWQPIVTAPKGTPVLVYLPGAGGEVVIGILTETGWYKVGNGHPDKTPLKPSRWMPVPEFPVD
jgi:hypothetical protein